MQQCFRCAGRKKLYKSGSGYSKQNTGGVLVDCPLCLGKGKIDKLELTDDKTDAEELYKTVDNHVRKKAAKKSVRRVVKKDKAS